MQNQQLSVNKIRQGGLDGALAGRIATSLPAFLSCGCCTFGFQTIIHSPWFHIKPKKNAISAIR
jgi:hypothetical protein